MNSVSFTYNIVVRGYDREFDLSGLVFEGAIRDVARKLGYEVERTSIYHGSPSPTLILTKKTRPGRSK